MTIAIAWNENGRRSYEVGADRAVLYPAMNMSGVPWNGLISVEESSIGGDPTPLYYDGRKYADVVSYEDFQAVLTAFTYPDEFEECDGNRQVAQGVWATQQPRKPFHLCYRSFVGNDSDGARAHYKLHLVYNALALPTTKTRTTIGATIEPSTMSWTLNTVPPDAASAYRPTAHIVIDSRGTDPAKIAVLESFLYGSIPEDGVEIIDGGTPSFTTSDILDGGTPSLPGAGLVDGEGTSDGILIQPHIPSQADVIEFLS